MHIYNQSEGKKAEQKLPPMSFYVGCHHKAWPRFRVDFPTFDDQIPHICCAQLLAF